MKRWKGIVIRVVVFLLLGAVVNVAVAWGCAILTSAQPEPPYYEIGFAMEGDTGWELRILDATGSTIVTSNRDAVSFAYRLKYAPQDLIPYWADVDRPLRSDHHEYRQLEARGWPWRSLLLEYRNVVDPAGAVTHSEHAVLRSGLYTHTWGGNVDVSRNMPLRPIVPGFLANTALYTVVLALVLGGPFALRRIIRIRRGRCPTCGYPIGVSSKCSECGREVARKKDLGLEA